MTASTFVHRGVAIVEDWSICREHTSGEPGHSIPRNRPNSGDGELAILIARLLPAPTERMSRRH